MNTKIFLAIFLTSALFLGLSNAFMLFILESSLKKTNFFSQDGAVVYETEFALFSSKFENHKSREEVAQALESKEGRSMRYSHSNKYDMLYFGIEILIVPIYAKNKFKGHIAFVRDMSLQAQALRREFSANVTHELKTPLSVILENSEIMQNNLIAQADFPQFVEKIQKEATKLLAMINEILKLSFLDERQAEVQKNAH